MPEMRLAGPRYKYPVSDGELKRRLKAVQDKMREKGLDCCIAQTQSMIFDSVIRYLTDTVANAYGSTLLIPAEGNMIMVSHGSDLDPAPGPSAVRNVEKVIYKPYCQTFGCTDGMLGGIVCREIQQLGSRRIGLISKQLMNADTLEAVQKKLSDCEFVDFTKEFCSVKAIKSPEEWALIDRALEAHRQMMDMVPAMLRPGRMEYEILANLEQASRYMGCDWIGNIGVGSGPKGMGTAFYQNFSANRRIEAGDAVTIMLEVSGPGGIYCELARTFCLGEPSLGLLNLYQVAKGAQKAVADAAKPGVTGRDLNQVYDTYVTAQGIEKNGRFVGHGQGYDMMEAPVICPREDMELKENMFLAIHPEVTRDGQFTICCDNFRVTKTKAERLTRTEQKIFVVEY